MHRRNGVDAVVVVEVGEFDKEEKFLDLDLISFAIQVYHLAVEGFGNATSGAAGSEDVVEKGEIESVAFGNTGGDIAETVEYVVAAIFLHDFDIVEVAFVVRQFSFFTDRDNRLDFSLLCEKRRSKEESTRFDGSHIGAMGVGVDVGY